MSELQKQIRETEYNIMVNNAYIHRQQRLLEKHKQSGKLLLAGMLGGFVCGFVFAKEKTTLELARTSIDSFAKSKRIYKTIGQLLSFLAI